MDMNSNQPEFKVSPFTEYLANKDISDQESSDQEKKISPFQAYSEQKKEVRESGLKSFFRYLYQLPSGYAKAWTYPADLIQMLGVGEASDPEELEHLRKIHERAGIPWDEDKYMQSVRDAASYFPTQGSVERGVEENFGVPLAPKTKGQKALNLASTAAGFAPATLAQKGVAGVTAPAVSTGLESVGVPEPVAEMIGLGASALTGHLTPAVGPEVPQKFIPWWQKDNKPPDLPPTKFGTAEEILHNLSADEAEQLSKLMAEQPKEPLGGIRPEVQEPQPIGELRKVTQEGEPLGIRASLPQKAEEVKSMTPKDLKSRVGTGVSKSEVHNRVKTGEDLQKTIRKLDEEAYGKVSDLYDISKELNSQVSDIHPGLVEELTSKAEAIEKIPSPSGIEKDLLKTIEEIKDSLVHTVKKGENKGDIIGYKPISNQTLIEQNKSLKKKVDYDFGHGSPKNIFKPTIGAIEDSILEIATNQGNTKAVEAIGNAKNAYSEWSDNFANDYIRKYRDTSNTDAAKLFDSVLDVDNFRVMRDLIGDTPEGSQIIKKTQREIVENNFSQVMKDPKKVNPNDLNRMYRELEPVLTPEQLSGVKKEIAEARKPFPKKVTKRETKKNPELKGIEVYTKKTPEQIESMMNSRSGIRELKKDLSKTKNSRELFDKFGKQKLQEVLRDGKVKANYTGEELFNQLNKKKNYDLLEELTSPQEAKAMLDAAEKVATKKFTMKNVKKVSSKVFKYTMLHTLLTL